MHRRSIIRFLGGKTAAFLVPIITAALKAGRKPAKELDGTGVAGGLIGNTGDLRM